VIDGSLLLPHHCSPFIRFCFITCQQKKQHRMSQIIQGRGVQLAAICSFTTRWHCRLHTGAGIRRSLHAVFCRVGHTRITTMTHVFFNMVRPTCGDSSPPQTPRCVTSSSCRRSATGGPSTLTCSRSSSSRTAPGR